MTSYKLSKNQHTFKTIKLTNNLYQFSNLNVDSCCSLTVITGSVIVFKLA